MADDGEKSESPLWAFNPISRRYVLRSGSTWARLVKNGTVQDPELVAGWDDRREATRQRQIVRAKEARDIGFGIGGGVDKRAMRAPESKPASTPVNLIRERLNELALANRDSLLVEGLSRAEAAALIRDAFVSDREEGLTANEPPSPEPPRGRWQLKR